MLSFGGWQNDTGLNSEMTFALKFSSFLRQRSKNKIPIEELLFCSNTYYSFKQVKQFESSLGSFGLSANVHNSNIKEMGKQESVWFGASERLKEW